MNNHPERIYLQDCGEVYWGNWYRDPDGNYTIAYIPADERKLHQLRRWVDELPDVDGWYWFDGEYEEYVYAQAWDAELPEDIWHKFQGVVRIDRHYMYLDGKAVELDEGIGTWIGPLLNPFEEVGDAD